MTKIGFFQFSPQKRTVGENVEFITNALQKEHDCLVVLPELFLQSYYDFGNLVALKLKDELNGLLTLSRKNKLAFVGSLPVKIGSVIRNRSYYIKNGIITRVGDKKKLYSQERKVFEPGSNLRSCFKYKNLLFTSCVCLDVLDPAIASNAVKKGIDLFIVNATVSVDFLKTITKARSLENQVVTIFANRSGKEYNGIKYLGNSTVFLPDGREKTVGNEESIFTSIEITQKDLSSMRKMRKELGIYEPKRKANDHS